MSLVLEQQFIESAVRGDANALERLLQLHWRRIQAYVREHLPDPLRLDYEPRDILQDVYRLAYRGIRDFKPQGPDPVFRWFVTICRHRMAELLRMRHTLKRRGSRTADDVVILLEQLAVSYRTPSQSAIRHELARDLEASIEGLTEDYQQVIRLRFFQGLDFQQIGVRMNRSRGSAQMLCQRALKQLKLSLVSASRYA